VFVCVCVCVCGCVCVCVCLCVWLVCPIFYPYITTKKEITTNRMNEKKYKGGAIFLREVGGKA